MALLRSKRPRGCSGRLSAGPWPTSLRKALPLLPYSGGSHCVPVALALSSTVRRHKAPARLSRLPRLVVGVGGYQGRCAVACGVRSGPRAASLDQRLRWVQLRRPDHPRLRAGGAAAAHAWRTVPRCTPGGGPPAPGATTAPGGRRAGSPRTAPPGSPASTATRGRQVRRWQAGLRSTSKPGPARACEAPAGRGRRVSP